MHPDEKSVLRVLLAHSVHMLPAFVRVGLYKLT